MPCGGRQASVLPDTRGVQDGATRVQLDRAICENERELPIIATDVQATITLLTRNTINRLLVLLFPELNRCLSYANNNAVYSCLVDGCFHGLAKGSAQFQASYGASSEPRLLV